jgi:hypothetical protein
VGLFIGRPNRPILISVFVIAVAVGLAYWWYMPPKIIADQAIWGQFGDYIGGIMNPVVSLATLLAVLHTLGQNQDLISNAAEQSRLAAAALKAEQDARASHGTYEHSKMCMEAALSGLDAAVQALSEARNHRDAWNAAATLLRRCTILASNIETPTHLVRWDLARKIHALRVRPLLGAVEGSNRRAAFFFGGPLQQSDRPSDTLDSALTFFREIAHESREPRHIERSDLLEFCALCMDTPPSDDQRARGDLGSYLSEPKARKDFAAVIEYERALAQETHGG